MAAYLIIENDSKFILQIQDAIKSFDPAAVIHHFKNISQFIADTDPNTQTKTNHQVLPFDMALIDLADIEIAQWSKFIIDIKSKMKKNTPVCLLSFDVHLPRLVEFKKMGLYNIIHKPCDDLILKETLYMALQTQRRYTPKEIKSQKNSAFAGILKDVELQSISELGFLTLSDSAIPLYSLSKYFSSLFDTDKTRSVWAQCLASIPHPQKPGFYNPLLFGNATEIKDKIIGAIVWSEPYYKRACENALLIVMRGLVWIRDHKNLTPTLEDVLEALSGVSGLTVLSELVEDEGIRQSIYSLITENKKELSKSIEGLKAEIGLMVLSEFGSIFKKEKSLNILEAMKSKKIILINLDGQTYSESAKKFGRMLLGDLRAASGAIVTNMAKSERPKFTVIVDEFSDIVSTIEMAESFVGFLNRCRGSGIGVVIAHQSLGDFKDDTSRKQIMDSTETFFSFVQKDPETCEILASIVGTEETWKVTEQISESILFSEKTGMGTRRLTQEYIYHPNVFKNLDTGMAVYVAKKPSRFGIVKIDFIEIPVPDPSKVHEWLDLEIKNVSSLNVGGFLRAQKANYNEALKIKSSPEQSLEI